MVNIFIIHAPLGANEVNTNRKTQINDKKYLVISSLEETSCFLFPDNNGSDGVKVSKNKM
jgi:hypothetical protein